MTDDRGPLPSDSQEFIDGFNTGFKRAGRIAKRIYEAKEAVPKPGVLTREQILEALADLNYDDTARVDDVVPRKSMDAIADAMMGLSLAASRVPTEEDIAKAIWDYGSPFRYPECLKIAAKVTARMRAITESCGRCVSCLTKAPERCQQRRRDTRT